MKYIADIDEYIQTKYKHQSHVLNCNSIEDIIQINQPMYNIAVLQRNLDSSFYHLVNEITNIPNFHFKETSSKTKIKINLSHYLKSFNFNSSSEINNFLSDIDQLISVFLKTTKSYKVQFLLTVVNTNMCELFHTDINELRLLCTYKGKGTLWVENENVNWHEVNCCKTNEALIIDQTLIHEAKPFEVLMLKGALHNFNHSKAIMHRSPTIEETKQHRLLLRIDTQNFGKL